MNWNSLWKAETPADWALRTALIPASWLYSLGWRTYRMTYRLRLKRPREVHRPVICVGGLIAGGAGKSPVALHLVDVLRDMGRFPVLGLSGYGSPSSEAAQIAPEGPLDPHVWGDEPAMARWLRPDLPMVVGRRRVLAAELVRERWPDAVLVMDDGFQHLPLAKHITIVLDPPMASKFLLPAGPYRVPSSEERFADLVIPRDFKLVSAPLRLETPTGEELPPQPVYVICALGRPEGFLRDLQDAGFRGLGERLFPDHDALVAGNLFEGWPESAPIATTAKDWVKLRERPDIAERNIAIARQVVSIEPREAFRDWLEKRLNEFE